MLMTSALFLTQILHSSYFTDATNANDPSLEKQERVKMMFEYFGTFSRCFLSMFEITLANWPPVARLLAEEVSEWFSVLCVLHKLTVGFAVVGVINGVVFQETFQVARTDDVVMVRQRRRAQHALQQKMGALFQALDINR